MNIYAIFFKEFDCEVWVKIKFGTRESINTIKELIFYQIENKGLQNGYVESYPFFQADWIEVGGRMDNGFDYSQIQEVKNDYGLFDKEEE